MKIGSHQFNRVEFAGSLGDLGTLIPLALGLILITGLSLTPVLLIIGLFYISIGIYYRLPIPVQPLKLVAAIAIAFPDKVTGHMIAATGFIFGSTLLLLVWTGFIDWIVRFFTKPIIRGIQFGLGLILITKGIGFIQNTNLFIHEENATNILGGIHINPLIGILGFIVTLFLLPSKRFPAALIIVAAGVIIGIFFGAFKGIVFDLGPTLIEFTLPSSEDFVNALFLLVIPQIPLTLGNAIIGTTDAVQNLFGDTKRATHRGFATSMGLVNIGVGFLSGMPVCHGAGGLAAHYRFGARTGGSNIMIGILFVIIALAFGKVGIHLLSAIPNSVLGVLLLFAGLELALLIKDIKERNDLFVVFLIAGISLATSNMGMAFIAGILIERIIQLKKLKV
ncbi:MAG: putative sulfate/molybdate transporter [Thermodesulfobacteriota bacterium]|nr:putative sulfate/molybdate transporter [Thermodesulfobacteriota bacterium]